VQHRRPRGDSIAAICQAGFAGLNQSTGDEQ